MRDAAKLDKTVCSKLTGFVEIDQETTISSENLSKFDYFRHFSHHLCAVGAIPIDDYAKCVENNGFDSKLNSTGQYLTPAACLNLYPSLFSAGANLDIYKISSLAKVYRHESEYTRYRACEFTVREFLFYGRRNLVLQSIEEVTFAIKESITIYKGALLLEPANDSFVPIPLGKLLESNQKKAEVKKEFVLDAVPIAIGSINVHETHFMKSFGINRENFITACIGVGLTRVQSAIEDKIIGLSD